VLPIRSCLAPGETEDVEFVYYGHSGRKFKGTCLCEVDGGPTYELTLIGEGSSVSYQLDRSFLDFGKLLYNRREEKVNASIMAVVVVVVVVVVVFGKGDGG